MVVKVYDIFVSVCYAISFRRANESVDIVTHGFSLKRSKPNRDSLEYLPKGWNQLRSRKEVTRNRLREFISEKQVVVLSSWFRGSLPVIPKSSVTPCMCLYWQAKVYRASPGTP